MNRSALSLFVASLLLHTSAFAGSIPGAWERDVNGYNAAGGLLKRLTACKNTISIKLDESLTQDPWPQGEATPGEICGMVAEQVHGICRDDIADPTEKAFIAHLINDNIDSIVCERSPTFTSMYKGDFVPSLSLKNGVLHVGIYFGKSPDGVEQRYTATTADALFQMFVMGEFLKAKGLDGAPLNLRQARMRRYFDERLGEHGTGDVVTAKVLKEDGLDLKLDVTDAAILAAFAEEKAEGVEKIWDGRELGFLYQVNWVFTALRNNCRVGEQGPGIKPACQKIKSVHLETRKGLTSAEFDPKTGRLTVFIESSAQLQAEVAILEKKYRVGSSGQGPLVGDVVMLPVMRVLTHDLGLPKSETHCYACGSLQLWEDGVLDKPLDASYSPPSGRQGGPGPQKGPKSKAH